MYAIKEIEKTIADPMDEVIRLKALKGERRRVIELDGIHKTYKMGDVEVHALRGVSLKISEGTIE